MQKQPGILRKMNKNVVLFLAAWSVVSFAYFGINAVLFNLFLLRLGLDTAFIGALIGIGQLFWAASAFPAGMIGARIGLNRAFALGLGLAALAILGMLQVELLPQSAWNIWLIGLTLLMWFGVAMNTVNSVPLLMRITDVQERKHAFAYQSAVMALFGFLGSLAAGVLPGIFQSLSSGLLGETGAIRSTLYFTPIFFLLGAFFIARVRLGEQVEAGQTLAARGAVSKGLLIFFFLIVFLQSAGDGGARAFLNIYLNTNLSMDTGQVGALMGVISVVPVVFAFFAPAFIGWLGTPGTITLTSFGVTAGSLILAAFATPFGAVAGMICAGIMGTVLNPARTLFGQEIVSPGWRSTTSALGTIGVALGWGLVAIFGGSVLPIIGFSGLFYSGAALNLLSSLAMVLYVLRNPLKKMKPTAPPISETEPLAEA